MSKIFLKIIFVTQIILSILGLTSCLLVKPGSSGSGKNLYETFYVGEGVTQYFVKPLQFNLNNSSIYMDFTFRYSNEINTNVIVNFNVLGEGPPKVDSLSFVFKSKSVQINSIKLLFKEKQKNKFVTRYTCNIGLADLNLMVKEEDWTILVFQNGSQQTFESTPRTRKSIKKLYHNLFILFES